MKRVILTGASGFLGNALKKHLINNGMNVAMLTRPGSFSESVECDRLHRFEYALLRDEVLVTKLKEWNPDVFVHLAWKGVRGSERNQVVQFTENIPLTLESVELAYKTGCKQWIGIGSQAEYGIINEKINEEVCCHPVTAYGKAKLAAGIAALGMCEFLSLNGSWCRIFSVYGPGDHPSYFIPLIIKSLKSYISPQLTACEQQWDYLFISDAISALTAVIEAGSAGIFNIGNGTTVSLKQVAELIKEQVNPGVTINYGAVPYNKHQIMHLEADISKLEMMTGWKPTISFFDGINETIKYFKK